MIGWGAILYGAGCIYLWSKDHLKVFGHAGKILIKGSLRWACTRILIALDGEKVIKLEAPPQPKYQQDIIEGSYDVTVNEDDDHTFYV